MQEYKGPKCIGMAQNIQDLPFSVKSVKKVLRTRVVWGHTFSCTWNILVDLQQMQMSEEHLRMYKQPFSLDTWRQVAPMWVVSWHAYFKSHGRAHWFICGIENILNTKSLQKCLSTSRTRIVLKRAKIKLTRLWWRTGTVAAEGGEIHCPVQGGDGRWKMATYLSCWLVWQWSAHSENWKFG